MTTTPVLRRIKCGRTRELLTRAVAQGFTVDHASGGHIVVHAPDGSWAAQASLTTGDQKSYLPLRSRLRRAGYTGS